MAHRSYALSDAKIGRDRSERSPYPRMYWVRIGFTERRRVGFVRSRSAMTLPLAFCTLLFAQSGSDRRQAVIGHGPRLSFVLFFLVLRERKSNVNGSGDVGVMITGTLPAAPA